MRNTLLKAVTMTVLGLASVTAMASNVAVIDSGTYFDHLQFGKQTWVNGQERAGNKVDDDRNGKVDDTVGWNFAENYSRVFFPEHIASIHPIAYRVVELSAKAENGTLTEDEKEFWNKKVKGLPQEQKQELLAHVNFYGQYAHGTHVSGIVASGNPNAMIMSARVFPDQPPSELGNFPYGMGMDLMKQFSDQPVKTMNVFYKLLAKVSTQIFLASAGYVKETRMDIANMSLGVPLPNFAKQYLAMTGKKNPTPEQIELETKKAFSAFEPKGREFMSAAPDTLFVVAAGNDGSDNDKLPYFPANMNMDNSITVAATKGYSELARFSCYGAKTVHIAAPGVAIMSSVPGPAKNMVLPMSGTSMAAPIVSMVASQVKDENPSLRPNEIKEILMGTVDKKDWLAGKVISGGIVNATRARQAAANSKTMSVREAIELARREVRDVPVGPAIKKVGVAAPEDLLEFSRTFVF